MKLTRFEVFKNGTSLKVGFMRALDKMGVSHFEELCLLRNFDVNLPIPDREVYNNPKATSYFTEEGLEFFGEDIEELVSYINNYEEGQYKVHKKEIEIELTEEQTLYGDSFQMIIDID